MSKTTDAGLRGKELMRAIINRIIDDPEAWNQRFYHSECGTQHCIAGWAQIMGGRRADSNEAKYDATELLGLDRRDSYYLFHFGRTFAEIYAFGKRFIDGTQDEPPAFPKL